MYDPRWILKHHNTYLKNMILSVFTISLSQRFTNLHLVVAISSLLDLCLDTTGQKWPQQLLKSHLWLLKTCFGSADLLFRPLKNIYDHIFILKSHKGPIGLDIEPRSASERRPPYLPTLALSRIYLHLCISSDNNVISNQWHTILCNTRLHSTPSHRRVDSRFWLSTWSKMPSNYHEWRMEWLVELWQSWCRLEKSSDSFLSVGRTPVGKSSDATFKSSCPWCQERDRVRMVIFYFSMVLYSTVSSTTINRPSHSLHLPWNF